MNLFPFHIEDTFPREAKAEPDVIPWTLDRAIAVFLNRWTWRADRATVEQELRELIAEATTKTAP